MLDRPAPLLLRWARAGEDAESRLDRAEYEVGPERLRAVQRLDVLAQTGAPHLRARPDRIRRLPARRDADRLEPGTSQPLAELDVRLRIEREDRHLHSVVADLLQQLEDRPELVSRDVARP